MSFTAAAVNSPPASPSARIQSQMTSRRVTVTISRSRVGCEDLAKATLATLSLLEHCYDLALTSGVTALQLDFLVPKKHLPTVLSAIETPRASDGVRITLSDCIAVPPLQREAVARPRRFATRERMAVDEIFGAVDRCAGDIARCTPARSGRFPASHCPRSAVDRSIGAGACVQQRKPHTVFCPTQRISPDV